MITMALSNSRVDSGAIHRLMTSEEGDVAKYIRKLGMAVVVLAKAKVGKRTGRLQRSITMRKDRTAVAGYAVLVGSDVRYALVHHQGARPHIIRARGTGKLRFRGANGLVFARSVRHPGHAANRYLTESLAAVVR